MKQNQIYRKHLPLIHGSVVEVTYTRVPRYSEMKINDFSNIWPATLTQSLNSDEMETFVFDFSPKFCYFRTNSRYGPV